MARSRNYKAEYNRRIAKGLARGLSRSQARSHPKPHEAGGLARRPPRPIDDARLQLGLRVLRQEGSLNSAAREAKISPERLRHFATQKNLIEKRGRRWTVKRDLPRRMKLFSNGKDISVIVGDFDAASKIGRYMAAVGKFLRTNNSTALGEFVGQSVTDITGKTHVFETRRNTLYRLAAATDHSFELIYRIIV
jgi:hypothetical protein